MIYKMNNNSDIHKILKYGKARGAYMLHTLLPSLSDVNNLYVLNSYEDYSGLSILICLLLYAFQIYTDFSGYSDMAVGSSKLFGIELKYIIILILLALLVISGIKKLFKLTITVAIIAALYFLYKMFF